MITVRRHPIVQQDLDEIVACGPRFETLAGKRVVVTGASGFLPAYMVETLLYLNETRPGFDCEVVGVVRNELKARNRFAHHPERSDFRLLVHDVNEPIDIDGPVDYIIHAASQASPKYFAVDPVGTFLTNAMGVYHLLRVGQAKNSQGLLYFSSGEVYGVVDGGSVPTREDCYGTVDPTNVRSCYAEGKRAAETLCVSWYSQHGLPTKIVRPFHTYGPGLQLDDGRVFCDFVANVVQGKDIEIKGDGRAVRAYCYLADAVRGFFTVLIHGRAGEAYNVGNPFAEVSVRELAEKLVGLFSEKHLTIVHSEVPPPTAYLRSPIPRNCPDTSKLMELGWQPLHSLESGFARTVRSFD